MAKNNKGGAGADDLPAPSLRRLVLYRSTFDDEQWNGAGEHAALITGVVSSDVVNLLVFPNGGDPVVRLRVAREGSFSPTPGFPVRFWAWQ
jgi:hypothetical protein